MTPTRKQACTGNSAGSEPAAEEASGDAPDFVRCHQRRVDRDKPHVGLLPFTDDTFSRHRHDAFVGQLMAALEDELLAHADDNDSSWVRWLPKNGWE